MVILSRFTFKITNKQRQYKHWKSR